MKPGVDYVGIAVAFCCVDGRGNFLFAQRGASARDEQGSWEFGGGGLDFGESPEAGVLREVREEYGCEGEIVETLPAFSLFRTGSLGVPTHWVMLPFVIKVNPEQVKLNPAESVVQYGWYTLVNVPTPLHPGTTLLIEKYKSYLQKYSIK